MSQDTPQISLITRPRSTRIDNVAPVKITLSSSGALRRLWRLLSAHRRLQNTARFRSMDTGCPHSMHSRTGRATESGMADKACGAALTPHRSEPSRFARHFRGLRHRAARQAQLRSAANPREETHADRTKPRTRFRANRRSNNLPREPNSALRCQSARYSLGSPRGSVRTRRNASHQRCYSLRSERMHFRIRRQNELGHELGLYIYLTELTEFVPRHRRWWATRERVDRRRASLCLCVLNSFER